MFFLYRDLHAPLTKMLSVLQRGPVGPYFVPDRSGFSSLVLSRFISRSMLLMPWLKSFPLPGSVILSAHFPSPVCISYGSFASAMHRYASNEIDSFANELSTRQIEKSLRVKHEKFKFSRRTKKLLKKNLWDSNSGIKTLKLSTEYLQFKT